MDYDRWLLSRPGGPLDPNMPEPCCEDAEDGEPCDCEERDYEPDPDELRDRLDDDLDIDW
jgi:hypothetical protein